MQFKNNSIYNTVKNMKYLQIKFNKNYKTPLREIKDKIKKPILMNTKTNSLNKMTYRICTILFKVPVRICKTWQIDSKFYMEMQRT